MVSKNLEIKSPYCLRLEIIDLSFIITFDLAVMILMGIGSRRFVVDFFQVLFFCLVIKNIAKINKKK